MNLLPLLSSFLLIFSLIAASFLKDFSVTKKQEDCYLVILNSSHSMLNGQAQMQFKEERRKQREVSKKQEENRPTLSGNEETLKQHSKSEEPILARENTLVASPKEVDNNASPKVSSLNNPSKKREDKKWIRIEESKFNLHALHTETNTTIKKKKFEAAANLIKILYGDAPFFDKDPEAKFEEFILNKLLETPANLSDPNTSVFALFPKEEKYHSIFYKLFEGTKTYTLKKNAKGKRVGYPPLYHFFTYKPTQKKLFFVNKASKPVLVSYFGEELAEKILEQKAKEKKVSAEFIQGLMSPKGSEIPPSELLSLVGFTGKKGKPRYVYSEDEKTGILIERMSSSN